MNYLYGIRNNKTNEKKYEGLGMPIKRINNRVFKEVKVYTLKRLLKRKEKYEGTAKEAEDYRKIEGIFFGKNLNPFKLLDRGIITAADVQEAINELEESGLIDIDDDNQLTLTAAGEKVAIQIKDAEKLSDIDDELLSSAKTTEETTEQIPIPKPVATKKYFKCPNCGNEISGPKNFCPKCGSELEISDKIECEACGNFNEPDSAFCVKCGKKLS